MKFISIFSALMLISVWLSAQTVKVVDKTTLQALSGIQIMSKKQSEIAITNQKGEADISLFKNADSIFFQHLGYQIAYYSYSELIQQNFKVKLIESKYNLNEIVISANKWEEKETEIPVRIEKIKARDISFQNPQTAADLLETSGYAYVQKSQLAGGSPMLRGFATNRILLVVDGVRMNNAIYRSGNLQNVISLDATSLDEAEILFGPGSVMYGSDAIGGVMDFHTLKPIFADSTGKAIVKGNAFVRYSTANKEKTGHVSFNAGFKKLAFVTSFTWSDFDDLMSGTKGNEYYLRPTYQQTFNGKDSIVKNDDPSLQVNSGYSQMNFMQKVAFKPCKNFIADYSFHYSASSDAPRYDRLILDANNDGKLDYAEWYYGPQLWMMNRLGLQFNGKTVISDHIRLTAAYQNYEESRHDRKFNNSKLRHQTESVGAISVNLDFDKKVCEKTDLFYGAEIVHNTIGSVATKETIATGEEVPTNTRYPDGSTWQTMGIFAGVKHKLSEKIMANAGLRYSSFHSEAQFDTSMFPFPFVSAVNSNGALNGSLGLVYSPDKTWKIYLNGSTGFRAPNMDDIGKVFDSEPGSVVVPNANLKPEYAYNAEAGLAKIFKDRLKFDLSVYYTLLENAIVRRPYTYNGQDSIMYDGTMSRVQAMQNIAKAYVYGIQTGISINLGYGFEVMGSFSYQKGEEQSEDSLLYYPKNHVAPLFGSTHLIYKRNKLKVDAYMLFNGKLDYEDLPLTDRNDNYIFAKNADGLPYTPAWNTFNLKVAYYFIPGFSISAGIENIADRLYRPYASGINAPGRNFIISLKGSF
ncbi:MAG: TonB-dependent receptor [Bacteroidetes bacterium HGW-Bacteroidetes-21]|jgi:hemoglobin/transferrin/lactoferrin receptor protein|nr:MAG: TonB-dependent receptor [Bacteroidetes bacterium HGW-Bacteroidetes-21]